MPLEASIVHSILAWLRLQPRSTAEKTHGSSKSSGRPDIIGCYHGRAVCIEVKTPDNRNVPSKKQLLNLDRWHKAGAIVIVAYSLKAVQKVLQNDAVQYPKHYKKGTPIYITHDEAEGMQSWGRFKVM